MFDEFPREVAFPNRRLVKSKKEYLEYIRKYNCKRNLHTTVYSYREVNDYLPVYESAIVNFIYFDFDGEKSYKGASKFADFLLTDDINFCVNLSGGGFHFYIAVNERYVPDIKLSLATLQEEVLNRYSLLEYNDPHVVGNVAQLTRIPNTFNMRRGCYCIPLRPEELNLSFADIRNIARRQRPVIAYPNRGKKLDLPYVTPHITKGTYKIGDVEIFDIEPCLKAIEKKRNPTNDERFFLCLWLSDSFRKGVHIRKVDHDELIEKIIDYMRNLNWIDFCEDPNKNKSTRYHVKKLIGRNWNHVPSCDWRISKKICPGKCLFYESKALCP